MSMRNGTLMMHGITKVIVGKTKVVWEQGKQPYQVKAITLQADDAVFGINIFSSDNEEIIIEIAEYNN